eukprot:6176331-Pleurochrysis_carterae.AAC.2
MHVNEFGAAEAEAASNDYKSTQLERIPVRALTTTSCWQNVVFLHDACGRASKKLAKQQMRIAGRASRSKHVQKVD